MRARGLGQRLLGGLLDRGGRVLGSAVDRLADAQRVTRFLAGALQFDARPDDVYVASYPRSGTTWMQYMLHLLVSPQPSSFEHLGEVSPWYERSLAIGSSTAADFAALPSPRIMKTHLRRRWVPDAGRKIYMVRDGADVAVSYFHLHRSYLGFTGGFDEFFVRFLAGDLQYGAWADHVRGWTRPDPATWVVRYEDLLADRAATMRRVVGFLGLPVDESRFAFMLERSTFDAMKAREAAFDHATSLLRERGIVAGSFLRHGRPGEGRVMLGAAQRRALDEASHRRGVRRARLAAFLH